jgi:hypothetical protein
MRAARTLKITSLSDGVFLESKTISERSGEDE